LLESLPQASGRDDSEIHAVPKSELRIKLAHRPVSDLEQQKSEPARSRNSLSLPALGKRKVADVARADVTKLHHANRAAPYQANRVLAALSKMFNLAERWGLRQLSELPRLEGNSHVIAGGKEARRSST
jgi:hypothetical protein